MADILGIINILVKQTNKETNKREAHNYKYTSFNKETLKTEIYELAVDICLAY